MPAEIINLETVPIKDVICRVENTPDSVILYIDGDTKIKTLIRTNVFFGKERIIRVHKVVTGSPFGPEVKIDTFMEDGTHKSEIVQYTYDTRVDDPIIRCIEDDFGISLIKD